MNKIAALLCFSLSGSLAFADDCVCQPWKELDKVAFQISARQWVSTETALLTVAINVSLSKADLVQARADIMTRLNKIATGEWHLTQFDRSQDSSGLEKLYVEAQARISQANLTDIYQNAKNVSKPGATYSINAVDFKPGLKEIQAVKAQMRERLYQQVNDELQRLNKVYTGQNYSVSTLVIVDGDQPVAQMRAINTMAMVGAAAPAPALSVSNEISMSAMVEAGSNRKGGCSGADKQ